MSLFVGRSGLDLVRLTERGLIAIERTHESVSLVALSTGSRHSKLEHNTRTKRSGCMSNSFQSRFQRGISALLLVTRNSGFNLLYFFATPQRTHNARASKMLPSSRKPGHNTDETNHPNRSAGIVHRLVIYGGYTRKIERNRREQEKKAVPNCPKR